MLITDVLMILVLVLFFSLVGLFVVDILFKNLQSKIFILPGLGLVVTIISAIFISAIFNLLIPQSFLIAVVVLTGIGFFGFMFKHWPNFFRSFATSKNLLVLFFIFLLSNFLVLIHGYQFFFGQVNFDFFYNAQDSFFLNSHDVNQFGLIRDEQISTFPLDWGVPPGHRFHQVSLASFLTHYLGYTPLHAMNINFHLTILILLANLFYLVSTVFQKSYFFAATIIIVFFTSAPFIQTYLFSLFGTFSGFQVFLLILIFLSLRRFANYDFAWSLSISVLLFALFIFYGAMLPFALLIVFLATVLKDTSDKDRTFVSRLFQFLVVSILPLILLIFFRKGIEIVFAELKHLFSLSVSVGSNIDKIPIVFTQYGTEMGPLLSLGIAEYPTTEWGNPFLTNFVSNKLIFLFIIFCCYSVFVLLTLKFWKISNFFLKLYAITFLSIFVVFSTIFFITGGVYGFWKISSWFFPLTLCLIFVGLFESKSAANLNFIGRFFKVNNLLLITFMFLVFLNFKTSLNYYTSYISSKPPLIKSSLNNINFNKDVISLTKWLKDRDFSKNKVVIVLPTGVESAWLSDNFRELIPVGFVQNLQVLQMVDLEIPRCKPYENLIESDSIVIFGNNREDVTPKITAEDYLYKNESFVVADGRNLNSFLIPGRGYYPNEIVGESSVRWGKSSSDLVFWARESGTISLEMEYSSGPLFSVADQINVKNVKLLDQQHVDLGPNLYKDLIKFEVTRGVNCIPIDFTGSPKKYLRENALIRPSFPVDPRVLDIYTSKITFSN